MNINGPKIDYNTHDTFDYDEVTDISETSHSYNTSTNHTSISQQIPSQLPVHSIPVSGETKGRKQDRTEDLPLLILSTSNIANTSNIPSTIASTSNISSTSNIANTSITRTSTNITGNITSNPGTISLLEATMASVDETFDPTLDDKPDPTNIEEEREEEGLFSKADGLMDTVDFPPGPSHAPPPPHLAPSSPGGLQPPFGRGSEGEEGLGLGDSEGLGGGPNQPRALGSLARDDDEDDDDDDDEEANNQAPEGSYDPADYEHLNVSGEISELFSYITRYTPQAIELEYRLRPYIPDYIPAVGDIDAFIKIPPPDGKNSLVGLEVLDEPSARQSDATVLDLQLRALAKHTTAKSMSVKTVDNAEKNGKVIEKWVRDISELHRSKPAPTVHYSKRMPDIDSLMQEWPGEVEELLKEVHLPNAALDLDLQDFVDIICGILDIPVHKSRIQSLHILFTLYSVFKNSSHFRQLAEDNYIDNEDSTADHLVIQ